MDRLSKIQGQKLLTQRVDFPFQNKIETINRLVKMNGLKILETTVRVPI